MDAIHQQVHALTTRLIAGIDTIDGLTLLTPRSPERRAGIVSCRARDPDAVAAQLADAGVICSLRAGGILRFAPHFTIRPPTSIGRWRYLMTDGVVSAEQPMRPLRHLTTFDATMLVMGGIVGVGIFVNPSVVANIVHSPAANLTAWAVGGLIALAGAFVYAELAARVPAPGGQYAYLRDAYHPAVAFMFGWATPSRY